MAEIKSVNVNILGQVCPACLLVALKELNDKRETLKNGEIEIVIKTDHRDATRTIPDSAKAMGYNVDVKKVESYYEIRVNGKK
jgi:TusA-related sulfurtransferase